MKYKDLTGLRIGKLTVLEPTNRLREGNPGGEQAAEAGGDLQLWL